MLVKDWPHFFGSRRPKIAALLSSGAGGSHFILHQLQGHPALLALQEHVLHSQLKEYFISGKYEIALLERHQLLPRKTSLNSVECIVLNKPILESVTYHFPFERQNIHIIQLVRNPISLYYSWQKGWDEIAMRGYNQPVANPASILNWVGRQFQTHISLFAHWWTEGLDIALNLESLVSQPNKNLATVFNLLGVAEIKQHQLAKLERCDTCNTPLVARPGPFEEKPEAVLYCIKCERYYLAAGGYNYIRSVNALDLASWKQKPQADMLQAHFSNLFGPRFMRFFSDEMYLQEDGQDLFRDLYLELLSRHSRA